MGLKLLDKSREVVNTTNKQKINLVNDTGHLEMNTLSIVLKSVARLSMFWEYHITLNFNDNVIEFIVE